MKRSQLFFAVADPAVVEPATVIRIVRLAHALDAEVVLFHFLSGFSPTAPFARKARSRCGQSLQRIANRLKAHGVKTEILIACGRSLEETLLSELKRRADILLMIGGCRSWRPLRRWSNKRDRLVELSPCDVLVLKGSEPYPLEPRIVASVGTQHLSRSADRVDDRVVSKARGLATRLDGRLDIYHVMTPWSDVLHASAELRSAPASVRNEVQSAIQDDAKDRTRRLMTRYSVEPRRVHIEESSLRKALPEFAIRHGADITLVGAPHRAWTRGLRINSSWTKLLDAMTTDVLLVKLSPPTGQAPADWIAAFTRESNSPHAAFRQDTTVEPTAH